MRAGVMHRLRWSVSAGWLGEGVDPRDFSDYGEG